MLYDTWTTIALSSSESSHVNFESVEDIILKIQIK
jgi:hypothetical protein